MMEQLGHLEKKSLIEYSIHTIHSLVLCVLFCKFLNISIRWYSHVLLEVSLIVCCLDNEAVKMAIASKYTVEFQRLKSVPG